MFKLVVTDRHADNQTFDLTKEQVDQIYAQVAYTPEEYQLISELTGLSPQYLDNPDVDYFIDGPF